MTKKLLPHFNNITTSAFALGVAEEFVLISIITLISYMTNWYSLWIGLFIAFILHLIIHCIQALIVKRYIPAIVTSIICLPICIYILKQVIKLYSLGIIALYSIIGFIIMVINLYLIHKAMYVFNKWVFQYEQHIK
jgi:hypothetical protein